MLALWISALLLVSVPAHAGSCAYGTADDSLTQALEPVLAMPFRDWEDVVAKLERGSGILLGRHDRRAIFMFTYAHTSREIQRSLAEGKYQDPRWVREMMRSFANLYRGALWADLSGDCAHVPFAWQASFHHTKSPSASSLLLLLLGIHAHASRDLPHALLVCGTDYDSEAQYHDYNEINLAFKAAIPATWKAIERFEHRHGAEGEERLGKIAYSWLVVKRENSWRRAEIVARSEDPARELAELERRTGRVAKRYLLLEPFLK